jgi:hypothetical protein
LEKTARSKNSDTDLQQIAVGGKMRMSQGGPLYRYEYIKAVQKSSSTYSCSK